MTHRYALTLLALASCAKPPAPTHRDPIADQVFERVVDQAWRLSAQPYDRGDGDPMPEALATLDYQGYRAIQFRPQRNVELGDGFEVQLFHRGGIYDRRVDIFVQPRNGEEHPLAYDANMFDLGSTLAGQSFPADLGFAGLRVYHGTGGVTPEFLVMQGASYFRLVGAGQAYGTSGRAVAVDTGLPRAEEFPEFFAFWLIESEPGSGVLPNRRAPRQSEHHRRLTLHAATRQQHRARRRSVLVLAQTGRAPGARTAHQHVLAR